jgi:hypothetical protein
MRKEEYLKSLTSNNNFDRESFNKWENTYNVNFSLPEALKSAMFYNHDIWYVSLVWRKLYL